MASFDAFYSYPQSKQKKAALQYAFLYLCHFENKKPAVDWRVLMFDILSVSYGIFKPSKTAYSLPSLVFLKLKSLKMSGQRPLQNFKRFTAVHLISG